MLEIVNPANGEKIQIADSDLDNHLNWQMAVNECKKLGNGWRLPTIEEIKLIPYNEMGKNVLYNSYWTSSETEKNEFNISPNALKFNFGRKMQFNASKDQLHLVRPIRTIQIVNQNNTSISNPIQNLNTVKAKSKNETKSPMKNALDSIPTTNFFQDLISGNNLLNTLIFISCLIGGYLVLFSGKFLFELYDKIGGSILMAILSLLVLIVGAIMMLAGVVGIGAALIFLFPAIPEVLFYNRNKKRAIQIAKEKAISEAKQRKEQAIQDEIFRKEQAKYEEEERIRKQRELEIWNRKPPLEKAQIKFKEMENSIENDNCWNADSILKEWEIEFQKYFDKADIRSAKDKIFYLRRDYENRQQRQREIKEERENQRQISEQAKDNILWYCHKCGRLVQGRNPPSMSNCYAGERHEWQLRG